MDVFGLRSAEIDGLYDWESNSAVPVEGQSILKNSYTCNHLWELVEVAGSKSVVSLGDELRVGCEQETAVQKELLGDAIDGALSENCMNEMNSGAQVLAVYGNDFYAGTPALTCNKYGEGKAYYICADFEQGFYDELFDSVVKEADVQLPPFEEIPYGVEVTERCSEGASYLFVQNFGEGDVALNLTDSAYKMIYGADEKVLRKYETVVLKKEL